VGVSYGYYCVPAVKIEVFLTFGVCDHATLCVVCFYFQ